MVATPGGWTARAVGLLLGAGVGVMLFALVAGATLDPVTRSSSGAVEVALDLPDAETLPELDERSEIVGPDGTTVAQLHGEVDRTYVPLADVPDHAVRAVLAAEDRRFFEHDGYDLEGIARALVSNFRAGDIVQGGSTISQQLAKASVGDEETLNRKIAELFQSMALEREHDKRELLEHYLNQVYFGNGAYGIGAAAEEFFATDAQSLRPEQAALLAAMIRSPALMDPRDNPDRALTRRNQVLEGMAVQGWLSEQEAVEHQQLPLGVVPERDNDPREPYIVDAVRAEFTATPEFGETREERFDSLYTDGLRITTTIDPDLQDVAEEIIRREYPERDGVTAAISAVDPRDGRTLVAAFGRDHEQEQYNLALQGQRQPGSAFKPFVMVAALEEGIAPDVALEGTNRATMGHDVLEPDQTWVTRGVTNYGGQSHGQISMTEAMHRSVNTAFAQLILNTGVDAVKDVTDRLGIRSSAYGDKSNPSIALGGLDRGVSPQEMASAYGTFATLGEHVDPYVISRVEDRHGNVIYEADREGEEVLDPAVAAEMNDVLQGVVESPRGTGNAAQIPEWPVAGKTGTTQQNADVWFTGYTATLSAAVWVGNPETRDTLPPSVTSTQTAAPLWREFTERALEVQGDEPQPLPDTDASLDVDQSSLEHTTTDSGQEAVTHPHPQPAAEPEPQPVPEPQPQPEPVPEPQPPPQPEPPPEPEPEPQPEPEPEHEAEPVEPEPQPGEGEGNEGDDASEPQPSESDGAGAEDGSGSQGAVDGGEDGGETQGDDDEPIEPPDHEG